MAVRKEWQPSGKPKNEPGSEKNRRESLAGGREAKNGSGTPKNRPDGETQGRDEKNGVGN